MVVVVVVDDVVDVEVDVVGWVVVGWVVVGT
jgi:hypothetical protein